MKTNNGFTSMRRYSQLYKNKIMEIKAFVDIFNQITK